MAHPIQTYGEVDKVAKVMTTVTSEQHSAININYTA